MGAPSPDVRSKPTPQALARDTVRAGGLEVDRAPVTNERYADFVRATGHRPPLYWEGGAMPRLLARHPVVGVDFFDALAFAHWARGALPDELEWLQATGLERHRAYAWGDAFRTECCNTLRSGPKGTSPVGAYEPGNAPSGCVDLCGNVWELTCAAHTGCAGSIVVKGGSWYDFPCHAKLEAGFAARVDHRGNTVGFRLVYGVPIRLPRFLSKQEALRAISERRGVPAAQGVPAAHAEPRNEEVAVEAGLLPGKEAVREALTLFDDLDRELDRESTPPPPAPRRRTTLVVRPRRGRGRRLLPVVAVAAFLLVAGLVVAGLVAGGLDGRRDRRSAVLRPEPPEGRMRRARLPVRRTPPAPESEFKGESPLEQAMRFLLAGTDSERDRAEIYLVEHPAGTALALERVVRSRCTPTALRSIRYVEEALREIEEGGRMEPLEVLQPPRQGLVLLFEEWDEEIEELAARMRWTGRAEGIPVSLVYSGDELPRRLFSYHGFEMGAVSFHHDTMDVMARRWGVRSKPAIAGLDGKGRLEFVRSTPLARSELSRRAAALKRRVVRR